MVVKAIHFTEVLQFNRTMYIDIPDSLSEEEVARAIAEAENNSPVDGVGSYKKALTDAGIKIAAYDGDDYSSEYHREIKDSEFAK